MRIRTKILLTAILIISVLLNFYRLDEFPAGLYMDEASIGQNAYSILKTGKDEYGENFPLIFRAFGDYKLPFYIYLTSVSVSIFGKTEFAIRFPSAFVGCLTVIIFFFMTRLLLRLGQKFSGNSADKFALLATFLLSTNPWFMQFVGPGFEATLGLFLFVTALYLLFIYYHDNNRLVYLTSIMFFISTLYTYNSYRIISPVIILLLLYSFYKKETQSKKWFFLAITFFILASIPIIISVINGPGIARFLQTKAFPDYENIYLKLTNYPIIFFLNYISYFSFNFLFNSGDGIGRHQIPGFGLFFRWQTIFLVSGIYYLLKSKNSLSQKIIISLLIISPLTASLTRPSPHSLRSFPFVIPLVLIITTGIKSILKKTKPRNLLFNILLSIVFLYEFSFWLHYYYLHYPKTNIIDWGANFKQMVAITSAWNQKYDTIAVSFSNPLTYIYYLFYDDKLKIIYPDFGWDKNKNYGDKPVLLITGYIDDKSHKPSQKLLDQVILPNDNKDIFAQFWEI